jgi:hypothetical protein
VTIYGKTMIPTITRGKPMVLRPVVSGHTDARKCLNQRLPAATLWFRRGERMRQVTALLAARDPVLRFYCDRAPLVAIGGLNQSPCQRSERHVYLQALCRAFPTTQFWGLGQANPVVVNGLGCAGLLDRVWVDGSWWVHDARAEVLAVLEDGLIKSIRLTRTGARSFFPLLDLMSCNLRSLLSAYAGLWTFPGPARVPTDLEDLDARLELRRRIAPVQLGLFNSSESGQASDAVPPTAAIA